MYNELLRIGPLTIYGYGFMIALGIIAAYYMARFRAGKYGIAFDCVMSLLIWCVVGGLISAKLLFWITQWSVWIQDPLFFIETLSDGFVVYGGIVGGIAAGYIYCRRNKLNFWRYFDLIMPSVALAQGFGRIGCFLAGCCYGTETNSMFSITFHNSEFAPNNIPLIPIQLYASALDFCHSAVLCIAADWMIRKNRNRDGKVAALYLIFYSIGRFVLEFFRGDLERGFVMSLSTSQFLSVFVLLGGVVLLCMKSRK